MFNDEDYDNIFVTQQSRRDVSVSLEEDMEFRSVLDSKYLVISEAEEEQCEERLR